MWRTRAIEWDKSADFGPLRVVFAVWIWATDMDDDFLDKYRHLCLEWWRSKVIPRQPQLFKIQSPRRLSGEWCDLRPWEGVQNTLSLRILILLLARHISWGGSLYWKRDILNVFSPDQVSQCCVLSCRLGRMRSGGRAIATFPATSTA